MPNFMYPRTVTITRSGGISGAGFQGYSGQTTDKEDVIAFEVMCSIQERSTSSNNPVGLPGDGKTAQWHVYIPRSALALGIIQNLDILTDDTGVRYKVVSPYWDSLGYRLSAVMLEA